MIKVLCYNGNAIFGGIWYQRKFHSGINVETEVQHGLKIVNGTGQTGLQIDRFFFSIAPANQRPVANDTKTKHPIHPALSLILLHRRCCGDRWAGGGVGAPVGRT